MYFYYYIHNDPILINTQRNLKILIDILSFDYRHSEEDKIMKKTENHFFSFLWYPTYQVFANGSIKNVKIWK